MPCQGGCGDRRRTIRADMISRHRVWHIVEAPKEGERADAFDVFIMVLIAFNVIAVILQSIRSVDLRYSRVFAAFEVFSVAVFTVEYGLRLWRSEEHTSELQSRV